MRRAVLSLTVLAGCGFELRPSTAGGEDAHGGEVVVTVDAAFDAAIDAPINPTIDAAIDAAIDAPVLSWVGIETLLVPCNGATRMSNTVLGAGVNYRLRASSTCLIDATTPADAEWWGFNPPTDGTPGVDIGLAVNDTNVDANRTPQWGAYMATHIYEVPWVGNGQRIVGQMHDGNLSNNTGNLMLTILAYQ